MNGAAAVRETHISWVFLIGDRAYKLKKPIRTGFLDFSTPQARRWMCEREVELNHRFSPDVYLGVGTVLDPTGTPCDSIVVMRRMPEARRLATLVQAGADVDDHLRGIARLIAAYHAGAATSPDISRAASLDSVRANWEANFEQMKEFYGSVLDLPSARRIESLVRTYLQGRETLFHERIAKGMARDGHGDLKADDIFCLDDGPRILDCIEFDDRLRYGDVLADVAFLAMDLERLGAPALGVHFMNAYAEFSAESHPDSLAHHYVAYRAHVRAKVACLRHQQGDTSAAEEASSLLAISLAHLERARIRMVLVGGLPASGKSTVAGGLADSLGWVLFRSDEVRKDLAGIAHEAAAPAALDTGLYRPDRVEAAYEEMLRRARMALERGASAILDATWRSERMRAAAQRVAEATCTELVELQCVAPIQQLESRLVARRPGSAQGSDATVDVLASMRFEPWTCATEVDTRVRPAQSVIAALEVAAPERKPVRRSRLGSARRSAGKDPCAGGPTALVWDMAGQDAHRLHHDHGAGA